MADLTDSASLSSVELSSDVDSINASNGNSSHDKVIGQGSPLAFTEETHNGASNHGGIMEEESVGYHNIEIVHGQRILDELMSTMYRHLNDPFMNAIDIKGLGLHDYEDKIKQPMWLKKMHKKFEQNEYCSIEQFVKDMRLMFENCYRYNGAFNPVSKKGQKLEVIFNQKLALLPRELREKVQDASEQGVLTGSGRRRYGTTKEQSQLLQKIREEEMEKEREARKQLIIGRRLRQEARDEEMEVWYNERLPGGDARLINSMWELASIGHFLFLIGDQCGLGEVSQFELERGLCFPRQSLTITRVLTWLLSTPHQRAKSDGKLSTGECLMPSTVIESKLLQRMRNWYKPVFPRSNEDEVKKLASSFGLDANFFQVLGLRNPLEKEKFHELTYYQRLIIIKALCDWCIETQESVKAALDAWESSELRAYELGTDNDGCSYVHFPQLCGSAIRLYKIKPDPAPESTTPKKSRKEQRKAARRKEQRYHTEAGNDEPKRPKREKEEITARSNNTDSKPKMRTTRNSLAATLPFEDIPLVTRTRRSARGTKEDIKDVKEAKESDKRLDKRNRKRTAAQDSNLRQKSFRLSDLEGSLKEEYDSDATLPYGAKRESVESDESEDEEYNVKSSVNSTPIKSRDSDDDYSFEETRDIKYESKVKETREMKPNINLAAKESVPNGKETVHTQKPDECNTSGKDTSRSNEDQIGECAVSGDEIHSIVESVVTSLVCEACDFVDSKPTIVGPDIDKVELVADSVDALRALIQQFTPEDESNTSKKEARVRSLYENLKKLLVDMEPFESRLVTATRRTKERLRKQVENFCHQPVSKAAWGSDEESSRSSTPVNKSTESYIDNNTPHRSLRPQRTRSKPQRYRQTDSDDDNDTGEDTSHEPEQEEETDISSRGRIIRRRVIPNNIEDTGWRTTAAARRARRELEHRKQEVSAAATTSAATRFKSSNPRVQQLIRANPDVLKCVKHGRSQLSSEQSSESTPGSGRFSPYPSAKKRSQSTRSNTVQPAHSVTRTNSVQPALSLLLQDKKTRGQLMKQLAERPVALVKRLETLLLSQNLPLPKHKPLQNEVSESKQAASRALQLLGHLQLTPGHKLGVGLPEAQSDAQKNPAALVSNDAKSSSSTVQTAQTSMTLASPSKLSVTLDSPVHINPSVTTVNNRVLTIPAQINPTATTVNNRVRTIPAQIDTSASTVNSRVLTIPAQINPTVTTVNNRVLTIPAQINPAAASVNNRVLTIPAQIATSATTANNRVLTMPAQINPSANRVLTIPAQLGTSANTVNNRVLTIPAQLASSATTGSNKVLVLPASMKLSLGSDSATTSPLIRGVKQKTVLLDTAGTLLDAKLVSSPVVQRSSPVKLVSSPIIQRSSHVKLVQPRAKLQTPETLNASSPSSSSASSVPSRIEQP